MRNSLVPTSPDISPDLGMIARCFEAQTPVKARYSLSYFCRMLRACAKCIKITTPFQTASRKISSFL